MTELQEAMFTVGRGFERCGLSYGCWGLDCREKEVMGQMVCVLVITHLPSGAALPGVFHPCALGAVVSLLKDLPTGDFSYEMLDLDPEEMPENVREFKEGIGTCISGFMRVWDGRISSRLGEDDKPLLVPVYICGSCLGRYDDGSCGPGCDTGLC